MNVKDKFRKCFNEEAQWFEFYGDVKEEIPDNVPEALGKGGEITGYADVDHTGDQITRRSHTRVIMFVKLAPIVWNSTCQATIDSSTFGSQVVALRTALDIVNGLQ